MKTHIRLFLIIFLFIGFYSPSSHAIIRTNTEISTSNTSASVIRKKSVKERLVAYFINKKLSTSIEKTDSKKASKTKKIINISIFSIAGLVAIYFLQGTLWLSLVALIGLFLYFKHKKHKNKPPKPLKPKTNEPTETIPADGKPVVVHLGSNARKSMRSFFGGLGSLIGAFLSIFLIILSEGISIIPFIGFIGLVVLSAILFSISISKALKSIKNKEEDKSDAVLWLVLSIILLIPIAFLALAFLTSGF